MRRTSIVRDLTNFRGGKVSWPSGAGPEFRARDGFSQEAEILAKGERSVAFQGEHGAYSELAGLSLLGPSVATLPRPTFAEVFDAVEEGVAALGIIPIENSLAGSVHENYDLLRERNLYIVGEVNLRIVHNLLANGGIPLERLRRVQSHPQALAQCKGFFRTHPGIEPVPVYDTAGAARLVKEQGLTDTGAIASIQAARHYGLDVLASGVEDNPQNLTRFLLLAQEPCSLPEGPAKTSLVFSVPNVPGALFKCLAVFALRDINLTKIESRPVAGRPWEYLFYLDFCGSVAEERCRRAVDHLRELATYLKLLGSYPEGETTAGPEASPAPGQALPLTP